MPTRIEPPMTRTRSGGTAPHVRTLGPVVEAAPVEAPVPSEYVKYPRAAKAVFALAAATIVFAVVQSTGILVVTAWLLLVGYILWKGTPSTGYAQHDLAINTSRNMGWERFSHDETGYDFRANEIENGYPGGQDAVSISRYGDSFNYN